MDKTQKNIAIGVGVAAVLAALGYLLFSNKKKGGDGSKPAISQGVAPKAKEVVKEEIKEPIKQENYLEKAIREIGVVKTTNSAIKKDDMLKILKVISHYGKIRTKDMRKLHQDARIKYYKD